MKWLKLNIYGLVYTTFLAIIATFLGTRFPLIGGAVFGILIGILINNLIGKPPWAVAGIGFTLKKVLQWAIIFLGFGINISQVFSTGSESFYVMILSLTFALGTAFAFGKLLNIPVRLTSLIGVGTAICGGSAIAAVSPIIEAKENEIAYAISTIFLFNILAVLIFPPLGHLLGLQQTAFGLWAGTAINDTSSVVAAGYAYGNVAGDYATIVKLTRTTMIIPISLIFASIVLVKKKKESTSQSHSNPAVTYRFRNIFPWFILWFLVATLVNASGFMSSGVITSLSALGKFMIVMALTAVGLSADFKSMLKTGFKPLALGLIVWFVVSIVSLTVQQFTGQL